MIGLGETIVLVVAIIGVASVLKALFSPRHRGNDEPGAGQAENRQLREQVNQLKDRIQVLERIATERETSLEREIEQLRDR